MLHRRSSLSFSSNLLSTTVLSWPQNAAILLQVARQNGAILLGHSGPSSVNYPGALSKQASGASAERQMMNAAHPLTYELFYDSSMQNE